MVPNCNREQLQELCTRYKLVEKTKSEKWNKTTMGYKVSNYESLLHSGTYDARLVSVDDFIQCLSKSACVRLLEKFDGQKPTKWKKQTRTQMRDRIQSIIEGIVSRPPPTLEEDLTDAVRQILVKHGVPENWSVAFSKVHDKLRKASSEPAVVAQWISGSPKYSGIADKCKP